MASRLILLRVTDWDPHVLTDPPFNERMLFERIFSSKSRQAIFALREI